MTFLISAASAVAAASTAARSCRKRRSSTGNFSKKLGLKVSLAALAGAFFLLTLAVASAEPPAPTATPSPSLHRTTHPPPPSPLPPPTATQSYLYPMMFHAGFAPEAGTYGVLRQVMFQYQWQRAISGSLFVKWEEFFAEFGRSKRSGNSKEAVTISAKEGVTPDSELEKTKLARANLSPTPPSEGIAGSFVESIFTKATMVASTGAVRSSSNQGQSGQYAPCLNEHMIAFYPILFYIVSLRIDLIKEELEGWYGSGEFGYERNENAAANPLNRDNEKSSIEFNRLLTYFFLGQEYQISGEPDQISTESSKAVTENVGTLWRVGKSLEDLHTLVPKFKALKVPWDSAQGSYEGRFMKPFLKPAEVSGSASDPAPKPLNLDTLTHDVLHGLFFDRRDSLEEDNRRLASQMTSGFRRLICNENVAGKKITGGGNYNKTGGGNNAGTNTNADNDIFDGNFIFSTASQDRAFRRALDRILGNLILDWMGADGIGLLAFFAFTEERFGKHQEGLKKRVREKMLKLKKTSDGSSNSSSSSSSSSSGSASNGNARGSSTTSFFPSSSSLPQLYSHLLGPDAKSKVVISEADSEAPAAADATALPLPASLNSKLSELKTQENSEKTLRFLDVLVKQIEIHTQHLKGWNGMADANAVFTKAADRWGFWRGRSSSKSRNRNTKSNHDSTNHQCDVDNSVDAGFGKCTQGTDPTISVNVEANLEANLVASLDSLGDKLADLGKNREVSDTAAVVNRHLWMKEWPRSVAG